MIRALRVARRGAMKARIQAGGQLEGLIISAPESVRQAPARADRQASCPRLRRAPTRPGNRSRHRVGVDTAGQLLVTAGDNPHRLRSEAAFARLCGVAPIPASSGRTDRHRLHRGGDRDANSALWRITLVRMRCHPPTRNYVTRRTAEGKTKTEIMRCLKRYIARDLPALIQPRLREGHRNS